MFTQITSWTRKSRLRSSKGMRFSLAALICLIAMGSVPYWNTVRADDESGEKGPVGSFMFSFLGLGPGTTVPGLTTLTSDGTLVSVTGSDQGGPANVFFVKNSAAHGVWSRAGRRSVGARALFLNFDQNSGVVVSITKVRIVANFNKDFNSGAGEFFQ